MYLKTKGTSYIGLSTTNYIRTYKDTPIDGTLTTGDTTINEDLIITGNFTYTGDGSYTKSEIDDRLDLKVNTSLGQIYTKLRTHGNMEASLENPLYVTNPTYHTNHFTLATSHQLMANSGSWIQFSREGITDTWQTGIDYDNPYVIRTSNSTNVVTVNQNGNVALTGDLDVAGRILIDGSHLNVQPKSSTSSETLVLDQSMSSEFGSDSHGISVYGRQGGNSHFKFYNGRSNSVCNVSTDGNLKCWCRCFVIKN